MILAGCFPVHTSTTADGVHYLDLIAHLESIADMGTARHDLAIHFQRDALINKFQPPDQVPGGEGFGYLDRLAIYEDLHVCAR